MLKGNIMSVVHACVFEMFMAEEVSSTSHLPSLTASLAVRVPTLLLGDGSALTSSEDRRPD